MKIIFLDEGDSVIIKKKSYDIFDEKFRKVKRQITHTSYTKNNLDRKSDQIEFLEESLKNKKSQIKNVHEKLLSKDVSIEDLVFEDGITFTQLEKKVMRRKLFECRCSFMKAVLTKLLTFKTTVVLN